MLNAAGKGHAWLLRSTELLATRALVAAVAGLLAALDWVLARLMAGLVFVRAVRTVRAVCAVFWAASFMASAAMV